MFESVRTPPHNFEAEQALLGAILLSNRAYERVSEFLQPDHFADPVHDLADWLRGIAIGGPRKAH